MTRLQIYDALARAHCTLVGFEYSTDALVEEAFHKWISADSPRYAVVIIDRDLGTGLERTIIEAPEAPLLE